MNENANPFKLGVADIGFFLPKTQKGSVSPTMLSALVVLEAQTEDGIPVSEFSQDKIWYNLIVEEGVWEQKGNQLVLKSGDVKIWNRSIFNGKDNPPQTIWATSDFKIDHFVEWLNDLMNAETTTIKVRIPQANVTSRASSSEIPATPDEIEETI